MDKKRGIKKFDMNQEASTSTSRSNPKRGRQRRMNKIEDGQAEKKLKKGSNPDKGSPVQMESVVDKLPPEMITEILKDLDTETILACRLVNWKWNGIASEICRSRSDIEIHVDCQKMKRNPSIKDVKLTKMSLQNFKSCLEKSKFFPCTRFLFDCVDWSTFDKKGWSKIITVFGEHIKCLKLKISDKRGGEEKLAVKLRSLLFNLLPNLQEFGIELNSFGREFPLFAESPQTTNQKESTLPNLKILYLNEHNFKWSCGIIVDLLRAAVNLVKIKPFSEKYTLIQNFPFLHSQRKLRCLDAATISLDGWFLSKIQENPSALTELKLKELNLHVYYNTNILSDASTFLSNFFESNKDELRDLETDPLGFLPQLKLPKFSKVVNLCVRKNMWTPILPTDLVSGTKLEDIFPALRSLELEIGLSTAFPLADSNSRLETLDTLTVSGDYIHGSCIARISRLFPNLKHLKFKIYESQSITNFREVGSAIWTHLKKLQSLELVIDVSSSANTFPAIDSCFTGFSRKDCARLYELIKIKEEKSSKNTEAQEEDLQPELDLGAKRKHPSILDLKDLKRLAIRLFYRNKTIQNINKLTLTYVSEEFAFKQMDNLNYEIETVE